MSDDVRWDARLTGETNPADFISEDRNNALVLGKDNKLFISRSQSNGGGGYEPPDGGIPKRDLSAEVQGLLNRAQQALLTETDPVYLADKDKIALRSELTAHNTANTSHADIRALITNLDRVRSTTFNSTNGDLKFTFQDNSTLTVNIFISNLARDITYDATTKEIVITKQDGSQMRISVSDLVDIYTGFNGAHIQITVESGNVIHAVLKAGTITEAELSVALLAKLAMKTDVATAISQHNADTTAHGIGELKDDIEDIKSDIEDLQADSGGDPMRGVAQFVIGSDIPLSKQPNGSQPITDSSQIEVGMSLFAQGNWQNWIDKNKAEEGDFVYSGVWNWMLQIVVTEPRLVFAAMPMNPGSDFAKKDDIPTVPTKVSAFENDSNFATTAQVATAKGEAIEAAADYTDEQVADAKLATQRWLPAVQTKSALPGALASTSWNYLCRVLHDPTPSNNGVWQAIPIDANNHAANWTWFGDNQDFIDELELEEALEAERTISDNSYLGKTAKAADSNKLDGKTASEYATAAQGTKADNALPAASQAVDSARLGGHLPDYFATAAALEATEFMKGDPGPQGPQGTGIANIAINGTQNGWPGNRPSFRFSIDTVALGLSDMSLVLMQVTMVWDHGSGANPRYHQCTLMPFAVYSPNTPNSSDIIAGQWSDGSNIVNTSAANFRIDRAAGTTFVITVTPIDGITDGGVVAASATAKLLVGPRGATGPTAPVIPFRQSIAWENVQGSSQRITAAITGGQYEVTAGDSVAVACSASNCAVGSNTGLTMRLEAPNVLVESVYSGTPGSGNGFTNGIVRFYNSAGTIQFQTTCLVQFSDLNRRSIFIDIDKVPDNNSSGTVYNPIINQSSINLRTWLLQAGKGDKGDQGDPGFGVPPLPNESGNFTLKVTRTNNGTQGQPVWVRE